MFIIKTANGNKNIPLQSFSIHISVCSLAFEPAGHSQQGEITHILSLNVCENKNTEDRLY